MHFFKNFPEEARLTVPSQSVAPFLAHSNANFIEMPPLLSLPAIGLSLVFMRLILYARFMTFLVPPFVQFLL